MLFPVGGGSGLISHRLINDPLKTVKKPGNKFIVLKLSSGLCTFLDILNLGYVNLFIFVLILTTISSVFSLL